MLDGVGSVSSAPQKAENKPVTTSSAPAKDNGSAVAKEDKGASKLEESSGDPEDTSDLSDAGQKAAGEDAGVTRNANDTDSRHEAEKEAETSEDATDPDKPEESEDPNKTENPQDPSKTGQTQTLPADFSKMSPEQQYNYLHDVAVSMAGGDENAWRSGNNEVNLIGIRSMTNGQVHDQEANKYDDTIYAVRMHDGKPEVYAFNATVDAGIDPGGTGFGYSGTEGKGFSHLADGSYAPGTFSRIGGGHWNVGTAIGQSGNVNINVDLNNDSVIEDNERLNKTEGAGWGICFHPGGTGDNVSSWSAGCQVIRREQYGTFENLINEDPSGKFGYSLVDGHNLPPVDENNRAVGVPNMPTIPEGTGGTAYNGGYTPPAATTGDTAPVNSGNNVSNANHVSDNAQASRQEAPAPEGYTPPAEGSPYGATNPLSNFMNVNAENVNDNLTALCDAAIEELNGAQQQGGMMSMGTNMMMLYTTYANSLTQKLQINPEVEQKVVSTLAQGGINAAQIKSMLTTQQNQQGMPADGMYYGRNPAMVPGVGGLNFTI